MNKRKKLSKEVTPKKSENQLVDKNTAKFKDNRSETTQLRQLQGMANASRSVQQTAQLQSEVNAISNKQPLQQKKNNTGLPDQLKSGIENLSGIAMDDVKVHRNSDKPAQLNAHAYAQGTDIHLASGQEKHLPHEAWHVVQQKQGRVKPTMQMKGKVNINDDAGLEKEADVMGAKATTLKPDSSTSEKEIQKKSSGSTVQRVFMYGDTVYSAKKPPNVATIQTWYKALQGKFKGVTLEHFTFAIGIMANTKGQGKPENLKSAAFAELIRTTLLENHYEEEEESEESGSEEDDSSSDMEPIHQNLNKLVKVKVVKGIKDFIGDPNAFHLHLKTAHFKFKGDGDSRVNFQGKGVSYDVEKMKLALEACKTYVPENKDTSGKEACIEWLQKQIGK